jgi:predicted CoA-binding protein
MNISEIFDNYKNIAVYGMSVNPEKAAHTVPLFLLKQGYNIIPVNPKYDSISGQKAYKNLLEIPDKIDILNVFRPADEALDIVEQAIERRKRKGDINLIWLQLGIANDEAQEIAIKNGFEFIQDKCIYVEYMNK